jgi:N-acetylmuramoyl-L-alanine amidase
MGLKVWGEGLIMIRLVRKIFLIMILTMLGAAVSYAGSDSIQVNLDGKDIVSDSPPVIVDGRTLIPARALFEAMGGTVNWNGPVREVTANVGDVNIKLTIDSRKAYINETEKALDVPARIIKDRTMIPVRFVTEAAGCQVSWDDKNRIVSIVSPDQEEEKEPVVISNIEVSRKGDKIIVRADSEITEYNSFKMTNPGRFVLDIKQAALKLKEGTINTGDNPYFKSIRYSQYTEDSVRIVADLTYFVSGSVTGSDSMKTLSVSFEVNEPEIAADIIEPDGSISKEDQEILDRYGLTPAAMEVQHKLVVIDAGHGGEDPGSRGYENGAAILNEKEVNLDVALRLRDMLTAAGVRLYMIRTEDVTIPLYDRQDTANLLEASLYVSIHNNSYTNSRPSGTEVHYHGKDDPPMDGISARQLAENLQSTLVAELGLANRGTKVSPELAVLRRTVMPAVIIEGAFISNPGDLSHMTTDDFREKYAVAAAKSIIETLNRSDI